MVIQRCSQTSLYWFSTYWFRAFYPFRPLIHAALIGLDVAKQPLNTRICIFVANQSLNLLPFSFQ
ncbi:hypothetical protein Hanom_Chr03g00221581 [Helianthus anomalus]